jgi:hypothetical protein
MAIMKKVTRACLSVFVISLFISMAAVGQDVLEAVPADALFAIRLDNFEYTLGQLDLFLVGIAPTPNATSMMGRMQLANALGDPNLSNVNLRGQMAIFGTAIQKEPNTVPRVFISAIIPVTDYKKFINSNPSATKPDSNGISTIGQMKMLVAQAGDYALLASSNEYAAHNAVLKTIKAKNLSLSLSPAQRKAAGKARIWGYGNVQQAMKFYGPTLFSKMDEAQKLFAVKDPNMAQTAQLMTMYIDATRKLMGEIKDITLTGSPQPDVLSVTGTLTAIPGTDIAEMLVQNPAAKGPNKLLGYLPDNAVMSMAARVDKPFTIKMYDEFLDIFAPMLGKTFTAEEKTKVQNLVKTSVNSFGNSVVFSMSADPNHTPPFGFTSAIAVEDVNAFKKSMESGTEMMNAPYWQDFFKASGIKVTYEIKRAVETYNGTSIDVIKTVIRATDPNTPSAKMIEKLYGDGLIQKMAIVNGLAVNVSGNDADKRLRIMIDDAKKGGPKEVNAEIKNAMALIPDSNQAEFVGTYNYLRLLKMVAAFAPAPMPFPADMFNQLQTKSNIAFAGNIGDGDITITIAVPKQHVLEIMSVFQMMLTQKQTQQQQMPKPQ